MVDGCNKMNKVRIEVYIDTIDLHVLRQSNMPISQQIRNALKYWLNGGYHEDINKVSERKDSIINQLQNSLFELQEEINKLKGESSVVLPATPRFIED